MICYIRDRYLLFCNANRPCGCQPHYEENVQRGCMVANVNSPLIGIFRAFDLYWIPKYPHLQDNEPTNKVYKDLSLNHNSTYSIKIFASNIF